MKETTAQRGSSQTTVVHAGAETISQLRALNKILQRPDDSKVKYPAGGFGNQMKQIAKVIKAEQGLEVSALDYRGWDHHINEGPIDGALGTKLADLSKGLGSFVEDLGPRIDRVLVLVMSEFGRTAKENGNNGTDHGHGGIMLALGGQVAGGKTYGRWDGLEKSKLYKGRDLPVHTDFRNIFAETLQQMFGYNGIKSGLFPEYTRDNPPLEFLKPA